MSTVDVIVPCYRYGHYLRQCVESVLATEALQVRVLIIDDASPDDSADVAADIARTDSRVEFSRHATNKGHIATYNEGIEWATGTYQLLLSADDYLLPGALSRAATLMDAHPEVGFVFGNAVRLDERGATAPIRPFRRARSAPRILTGQAFIEACGARNIVPTPTAVVRTSLQRRLGGYRPELPHSGDMEMWWRFSGHGSVGFIEADQGVYRVHAANMHRQYERLTDFQQREAAISQALACNAALASNTTLCRQIWHSLATDAVEGASALFNCGDDAASDDLAAYAAQVDRTIRRSWVWRKLSLKRRMGPRVWHVIGRSLGRAVSATSPES